MAKRSHCQTEWKRNGARVSEDGSLAKCEGVCLSTYGFVTRRQGVGNPEWVPINDSVVCLNCLKYGCVWTLPKLVVPTWLITSRQKRQKAPRGCKPLLPFSLMVTGAQKAVSALILISSKSYLLPKCDKGTYILRNWHLDSPSSSPGVLTKGNKQSQSLTIRKWPKFHLLTGTHTYPDKGEHFPFPC